MSRPAGSRNISGFYSGNPVQRKDGKVILVDWLINQRDSLLDRLGGINAGDVLNVASAGSVPEPGMDPAADLKRALDRIKASAVDETGAQVDYALLRASAAYQEFRAMCSPRLRTFDPAGITCEEQVAFWINLYNALVIDAVITFDIQRSVGEGRFRLLAFFRRAAYIVGGKRVSLDDIEHGILRANRGHPFLPGAHYTSKDPRLAWVLPLDPRVHFALNCASQSCPPFQVYRAEDLDEQLEMAACNFVNEQVLLKPGTQILVVSSIFRWFKDDFGGQAGIISFLIDHLPFDGRRAWLSKNKDVIKLRYEPYDWNLNSIVSH
jgi:hypothetical protein